MRLEGAVDTEAFHADVEPRLRPTLKRGDVLVLDNLSAHPARRIAAVAAASGAQVIGLAPSSPDFSPREMRWSTIKTAMRAAKAGPREALEPAVKAALELLTQSAGLGWFTPCGYQVTPNCN